MEHAPSFLIMLLVLILLAAGLLGSGFTANAAARMIAPAISWCDDVPLQNRTSIVCGCFADRPGWNCPDLDYFFAVATRAPK
jgi:hypothetical protein